MVEPQVENQKQKIENETPITATITPTARPRKRPGKRRTGRVVKPQSKVQLQGKIVRKSDTPRETNDATIDIDTNRSDESGGSVSGTSALQVIGKFLQCLLLCTVFIGIKLFIFKTSLKNMKESES